MRRGVVMRGVMHHVWLVVMDFVVHVVLGRVMLHLVVLGRMRRVMCAVRGVVRLRSVTRVVCVVRVTGSRMPRRGMPRRRPTRRAAAFAFTAEQVQQCER
jgi:hypothetical protein